MVFSFILCVLLFSDLRRMITSKDGKSMASIERFYKQTRPSLAVQEPSLIEDFFDKELIIVLGQPGIGKTTEFKVAESCETNSIFITVGEFLYTEDLSNFKGKILYLDGLDEQRSKYKGRGVIDALIAKLKDASPQKIRISCRIAEWHGKLDFNAFEFLIKNDEITQIELQPLTEESAIKLLSDDGAEDFIQGAKDNGLQNFLFTPGNLLLLYEYYKSLDGWPKNRTELMEGSCNALLQETNQEHEDDEQINDIQLAHSSEYLAAVMMLSGIEGIAISRKSRSKVFPSIHQLDDDLLNLKVAAQRRLFVQIEDERFSATHRKVAEYLAAKHLSKKVRAGLSLNRVMSLLTGFDGKTAPDLRGVYAWLVTLLAGSAEKLLEHDPYGAVIYGDTYSWTPNTKLKVLEELQVLAIQDPWFRKGDYSIKELGGLADVKIIKEIIEYINNDDCNSHFISVVLDSIRSRRVLNNENLTAVLMLFIKDDQKPDHYRSKAIKAIHSSLSDPISKLIELLNGVSKKHIIDETNELLGSLLDVLYPNSLSATDLITYLIKPNPSFYGDYMMLINYEIAGKSDAFQLKELASVMIEWVKDEPRNCWKYKLSNSITFALIKNHCAEERVLTLLNWLKLNIDKDNINTLNFEKQDELRSLLLSDKFKLFKLFICYIEQTSEKKSLSILWKFNRLVCDALTDQLLVELIIQYYDFHGTNQNKVLVFDLLCIKYFHGNNTQTLLDIDKLLDLSTIDHSFIDVINNTNKSPIDEYGQKLRERVRKREAVQLQLDNQRLIENVNEINTYRDEIRVGNKVNLLQYYSQVWVGQFIGADQAVEPKERLKGKVSEANIDLIKEGWRNALTKDYFNSVKDIAETNINGDSYHRTSLMLVAIEEAFHFDENYILQLPQDILRQAIAYFITIADFKNNLWVSYIIKEKEELVISALQEFWTIQLTKQNDSISNFNKLSNQVEFSSLILKVIPNLLEDFPKISSYLLKDMIRLISTLEADIILPLVKALYGRRYRKNTGKKAIWLSLGVTFDFSTYYPLLQTEINVNPEAKWIVCKMLCKSLLNHLDGKYIKSAVYRKNIFLLVGNSFENVYEEVNGSGIRAIGNRDVFQSASLMRNIIQTFSYDTSDESTDCLQQLIREKSVQHWHSEINYSYAEHLRNKREAKFTYPSLQRVVSTLSNLEPANASDLKALVMDCLIEIASDIRHNNANKYKWFWNTEKGKANDIHINENDSRDILLDLLRAKLKHLDIVVEPEVSYVDEKRADIGVYFKGMKLPIEIKRDDHDHIWTSAENQLERLYTSDPDSEGNGIYLLFWFDGKGMTKQPKIISSKPTSAIELKKAIDLVIPERALGLIESIVIDVSVPEEKRAK